MKKLLGKPELLGLPYHGLVENGVLTLPNGDTKSIPSLASLSGVSVVIRHPGALGDTRAPEEQSADLLQNGREYRDYLLLNYYGDMTYIAGHALDDQPCTIYIDPAGTPWVIRSRLSNTGAYTLSLRSLFGQFEIDGTVDRTLYTTTVSLKYGHTTGVLSKYHRFSSTSDGSKIKDCLYEGNIDTNPFGSNYIGYYGIRDGILRKILSITISGTGSLDPATLGDGITASVTEEVVDPTYSVFYNPVLGNYYFTDVGSIGEYDPAIGDLCLHLMPQRSVGVEYGSITDEVITEFYEGDQVKRIELHTEITNYYRQEPFGSGCYNCITHTDNTTDVHCEWQKKLIVEQSVTGINFAPVSLNLEQFSDISGGLYTNCDGEFGYKIKVLCDEGLAAQAETDWDSLLAANPYRLVTFNPFHTGVEMYETWQNGPGPGGVLETVTVRTGGLQDSIDRTSFTGLAPVRYASNPEESLLTVWQDTLTNQHFKSYI